jgi:hypothetical protein
MKEKAIFGSSLMKTHQPVKANSRFLCRWDLIPGHAINVYEIETT